MIRLFASIKSALVYMLYVMFRHYDFPCECGLLRFGHPGSDSPVFLSGNYAFTVNLLKRVLRKIDCYLLVSDSSGSNVWCASGMNEFSEHDIIDAITVARLNTLVTHRKIIAPPFCAPGVDLAKVREATGFRMVWGPVHLRDIPAFVRNGFRRTNDMVWVKPSFRDRVELAIGITSAYLVQIGGLAPLLFFYPQFTATYLLAIAMTVAITFANYILPPWLPEERYWSRTLTFLTVLSGMLIGYGKYAGWDTNVLVLREAILVGIVLIVQSDGVGGTAERKSTLSHWFKLGNYRSPFNPVIDPALCKNCLACIAVCPKGVLARRERGKKVVAVSPLECIECLACVKQCSSEAILDRNYLRNRGVPRSDVRSIPNLASIVARDPSHVLASENQWVGAPTIVREEHRFVDPAVEARLVGEPVKNIPEAHFCEQPGE